MRAAVTEANQDGGVVQQLGHAVDTGVERRHGEFEVEVVGQGQIEQRVDPILAFGAADLGDGHAFETFQFRRARLMQGDAFPVAERHRVLQLFAELVAERGVAINRFLRLLGFVLEHALP